MIRYFAALALALFSIPAFSAELGEDGLYKVDWFAITFRDIAEDIETATDQGKRLALIFEQRGCSYCKEIHEQVLTDPEVRDYIRENFMIVQYNLFGDEEVTDIDGEMLTEKTAARKWGVVFTPTIFFLSESAPAEGDLKSATVATMPGAFHKGTFLDMFAWVREKGYESDEGFQRFHARKISERQAAGQKIGD